MAQYPRPWLFLLLILLSLFTPRLRAQVDLDLTISVEPDPPVAGQNFTLTVVLHNKGESAATSIALTNNFSSLPQLINVTGEWSNLLQQDEMIVLSLSSLPAGKTNIYQFTVRAAAGTLIHHAVAIAAEAEEVLWNNSFTFQAEVQKAATLPPVITINSPAPGATIPYGFEVQISASASDPDGSVARVALYVDNSIIADFANPPFTTFWRPLTAGRHTLLAVAYDNLGSTTSTTLEISVEDPPLDQILSAQFSDSDFEVTVSAMPGKTYVLLASDDFSTWAQVDAQPASEKVVLLKDTNSRDKQKFYRVRRD